MTFRRFYASIAAFTLVLGGFSFTPSPARAAGATLYLSPAAGSYSVGSTLNVSVLVNTGGQNINAVEADLRFPADKLQVVTPAAGPSIITVWAAQPSFSNANGTINFKGGVPSPGVNMTAGSIATVTFRVTGVGQAGIRFTDNSKVLLNDGAGTNVLSDTRGAIYTLALPPPEGPLVTSPTHPDPSRWYQDRSPVFVWEKLPEVTAFSYMLNDRAVDNPDDIPDGAAVSYRYDSIGDGNWFFHIKARGPAGWGGVTHFQIKIDATAPAAFPVEISPRERTSVRQPVIFFDTTDNVSGMDHFEIKLVNVGAARPEATITPFFIETESPFRPGLLELGTYDVIVRAFDHAGNQTEVHQKLKIVPFIYQLLGDRGVLIRGTFVIAWPVLWVLLGIIILLLLLLLYYLYRHHQIHDAKLRNGIHELDHPVAEDLRLLREKQQEYGKK